MKEPTFDLDAAHRWFGVTLNNRAWDLLESSGRTEDETDEMIAAAHASRYHWLQVGGVASHARAECLVANAHSAIGEGEPAVRHARRCLQLTESHSGEMADWDRAFSYDAMARALAAAGHQDESTRFKGKARESAERIADAADQEVFERWFVSGSWHDLE